MKDTLIILKRYFKKHSPVIVVNTSTDKWLLCLSPNLEINNDIVLLKFNSLNERWWNNITIKNIQSYEDKTLYIENDQKNIMMLQEFTPANYNFYIKPNYTDNPQDSSDFEEIKKSILSQKSNNY